MSTVGERPRRARRRERVAALVGGSLLLAAVWLATQAALNATRAAGIALVQAGPVVSGFAGVLTLTLPATSTAGDLLVATVSSSGTAFTAPAGWSQAVASANGSRVELWYLANNPGGINSVTFTAGVSGVAGQLSEWSGVATSAPLDVTGSASAATGTQLTVATSTAAGPGELAVTAFEQSGLLLLPSFTPGPGWSALGRSSGLILTLAHASDYQVAPPAGVVSETVTSSQSGSWAGVIATFKPPCGGGGLSLSAPASVSFGSLTLSGMDQSLSAQAVLTVTDLTTSGAGWNISGTSTTFTNVSGRGLPTGATAVTAASASPLTGSCSPPQNLVSYPVTLPAGTPAPPAAKLYAAAAGTGVGPNSVSLTFRLIVPANTYYGNYTSTWTFTIASGP